MAIYVTGCEFFPLAAYRALLTVRFSDGQRGKLKGPHGAVNAVHTSLQHLLANHEPFEPTHFPTLRIGSGYEPDW